MSHTTIVVAQDLENTPITLDVWNEPIEHVMSLVARRLDVQVARSRGAYYIGTLRPEDRGVLVRKVSRLDRDGLDQAVQVLLSDIGKYAVYSDGVIAIGDRVDVLERVADLLDRIERAPVDVWCVQLYLIAINENKTSDFGLDFAPALDIAYAFSAGSGNLGAAATALSGSALTGGFQALLKATATNEALSLTAAPMFLLLDGHSSKFTDATRQPVPKRTVSAEGTVTTVGFDYLDVGLVIEASVRDLGQNRGQLAVDIQLNTVVSMVEDAPITAGQTFQTLAACKSGGVYLLGTLDKFNQGDKITGPAQLSKTKDRKRTTTQIWARLYRIAGPANIRKEVKDDEKQL